MFRVLEVLYFQGHWNLPYKQGLHLAVLLIWYLCVLRGPSSGDVLSMLVATIRLD